MDAPLPPLHAALEFSLTHKLARGGERLARPTQRRVFLAALVVSDAICLALALSLAYWLRFESGLTVFREEVIPHPPFYVNLALLLVPTWLALLWLYRLYDWRLLLGGTREYQAVFQASLSGAILVAMVQFFSEQFSVARGWVGLTWALVFVLVTGGRFALRRLAYAARRRGYLTSPALILGANEEARLLGQQLAAWPTSGLTILGYLDDRVATGKRVCANLYSLGSLDHVEEYVRRYGVEELIIATSALSRETVLDLFRRFGAQPAVHLRLSSGLFEMLTTPLDVQELGYVPLVDVSRVRLTGLDLITKTTLDYTLAALGVLILSPVLLTLAVMVKRDSPGPVFYRRRVMGLNGRQFHALKFRTMRTDGDALLQAQPAALAELAATHKLKADPRVTRLGQTLRKYSLDELPQLFNVLRGEMSLVGPRMISPPELPEYGQWGMNLLTVKPGLTGLWQVSGRSDITYADRVRLDMHYIRNYSIWLDVQLIWQTIPVVLGGRGAY